MKHLILDFETFGQNVMDCAVIDCSVITVDTEKMLSNDPYTLESISLTKKFKLSVKDQVDNYGWVVYKDTLEFWQSLPEKARKNIKPKSTDLSLAEFVDQFLSYLIDQGQIDYWWSRSNTFDPILIWRIFNSQNKYVHMNEYLRFWRVRDTRTFIDAKLNFPKKNGFIPIADEEAWQQRFVEHDSSWDILADTLRMQAILRAENDLEMVKR
jgi:hypothetical protein